jgi:alpha-1,2-mannosyltransferase
MQAMRGNRGGPSPHAKLTRGLPLPDGGSLGARRAVEHALLVLPLMVTAWLMVTYLGRHELAVDFHHDFWVAGTLVRHGLSPYAWSRAQISQKLSESFPYPAPAALLFVPFSLLPVTVADIVFVFLSIGACLMSLWLLDVRDWRVYSVALLWWPVINGWQTANVTLLLLCGLASIWRWRDRPIFTGVMTAILLSLKPIVWPLLLWLLLTRRLRAAGVSVATAAAINLIGWAVLGFGEIGQWRRLLELQTSILYARGYGVTALAVHLGGNRMAATALQVSVCAVLVVALMRVRADCRRAFSVAVLLMLTASPLLDSHYFALLIVPIALASPSLSAAWLVPLMLWLCPATQVRTWQALLAWFAVSLPILWLLNRPVSGTRQAVEQSTTFPRKGYGKATWEVV